MKRRFKIIIVVVLVVVIVFGAFVVWAETPPRPMNEAFSALKTDSSVEVSVGDWLVFKPVSLNKNVGLVLYPGGRVDFRSYSPSARMLAERGYFVVIVRMPFNLAVFGVNKVSDVIDSFPQIDSWVIGGHSLGVAWQLNFVMKILQKLKA